MDFSDLPTLNAFFNSVSALFLLAGYGYIRKGDRIKHRNCMFGALAASALFLTSYLIYHYTAGSKPFEGVGAVRSVYFSILISHTILAVVIVPLVILTLTRALKTQFIRHRRVARWTLPIWIYVSVTGVVIYLMLYVL